MKKLFSLLLALLVLFSLASTAYASGEAEETLSITTEDFSYFIYTTNTFNIVSGTANCGATALCTSSVDRIDLSIYLQRYDGGWITIAHWNNSTNYNYASLSAQYPLTSGYSYRLRNFYYAYIDGYCVDTNIVNYYRDY